MKIGVLSDAHGNLDAFEACVAAMGKVDALLFGGDLLGYYFEGRTIMRRLRELGAICLAGNHDLYFLSHLGRPVREALPVPDRAAYRAKYGPSLERAAGELTADDVDWLAALPCARTVELGGRVVQLVHGSPWRPADEYVYPDFKAFDRFSTLEADAVVMGHTHRPFVREGPPLLVNAGSCGQPRDGDPRASYAVLEIDGSGVRAELHRVAYDREPLLRQCRELAPDSPLLTELLLRETKRPGV